MWIDDHGVLWHVVTTTETITAEDAFEVRRLVAELTGGHAVPAIIDIRAIGFADRRARDAFGDSADDSNETATALIVSSSASRTMAQVFLRISKPRRPVKVFVSEDKALEWVRTFLTPEPNGS